MKPRALSLALIAPLLGCALLEDLQDDGGVINVFATHHGTPADGAFPERDGPIVFVNEEGWQVVLREAVVVTQGVTLFKCGDDGESTELEMYWGALPEDFIDEPDLDPQGIGGVQTSSGEYCGMTVRYGPFQDPNNPEYYPLTEPRAMGSTVYLAGSATKEGFDEVFFEVNTSKSLDVLISLQDLDDGGPVQVNESANPRLVIAKVYDHYLEGVDFSQMDALGQDAVDMMLLGVLETDTVAWLGDPKAN
jgi:hypothetical protein